MYRRFELHLLTAAGRATHNRTIVYAPDLATAFAIARAAWVTNNPIRCEGSKV